MKGQDMTPPIQHRNPHGRRPGSKVKSLGGYILIYEPTHPNANSTGYVGEHRKVMSDCLGRPLHRWEEVHHKNGNRSDNRLVKGHELHCPGDCCNLELWSKSHLPGQRVSDMLAWATKFLVEYAVLAE
jgi:hypothetical protein